MAFQRIHPKRRVLREAASSYGIEKAMSLSLEELYDIGIYHLRLLARRFFVGTLVDKLSKEALTLCVYSKLHKDESGPEISTDLRLFLNRFPNVVGEIKQMDEPIVDKEEPEEDAESSEDESILETGLTTLSNGGAIGADYFKNLFRDSTVKCLREVYVDAGSRDKARYALASIAVYRILLYKEDLTRSMLFAIWDEVETSAITRVMNDEAQKRSWQRDFVSLLEKKGCIQNVRAGHTNTYALSQNMEQAMVLVRALSGVLDGDGYEMKALLWPKDYPPRGQGAWEPEEEDPDPTGGDETPSNTSAEFGVVQEVSAQLAALVEAVSTAVTGMTALEERLREREEEAKKREEDNRKHTETLLDTMEELVSSMQGVLTRLEREERIQIQSIRDRLTESISRHRSAANQAEAEARRQEKLSEELTNLLPKLEPKDAKPPRT